MSEVYITDNGIAARALRRVGAIMRWDRLRKFGVSMIESEVIEGRIGFETPPKDGAGIIVLYKVEPAGVVRIGSVSAGEGER